MSNITFEGLDKILSQLDKIGSVEQAQKALGKACLVVEGAARENAPKGERHLRDSIKSKVEGLQGIVYTPLEYAPYVEYGTGIEAEGGKGRTWDLPWSYQDEKGEWHSTSGQKPQPFMRPALDENRQEIIRILKEGITSD